jgi:general secretion pathway protein A
MFLDFYKLREQPFGATPDPRFLYLGPTHREAMAALFCGIEAGRGFLALVAEPGMGKTTLLFQLLERMQHSSRTVFLFQTQCDSRELVRYLLSNLGIDTTGLDIVGMHDRLNEAMAREMLAGRRFILVIDEAQNLDPAVLETVRLLSDFETPHAKMLQIILAGQTELANKLASPGLEQLRQRIGILARLEPFSTAETARYIEFRLQAAGYVGAPLFTPDAVQLIARQSRGIPRNINNLCFNALALSYALGRKRIDASIVEEALADLDIGALTGKSQAVRRPAPQPIIQRPVSAVPRPMARLTTVPAPLSQPKALRSDSGSRALGTAGVAALVATLLVGGLFALSSKGRVWRSVAGRPSTEVVNSAETVASSDPSALQSERSVPVAPAASGSVEPQPSASEVPSLPVEPGAASGSTAPIPVVRERMPIRSRARDTFTVVVKPHHNLRQICLRYLGQYTEKLVGEILQLNPEITDPNHLAIGQEIRLSKGFRLPGGAPLAVGSEDRSKTAEMKEP